MLSLRRIAGVRCLEVRSANSFSKNVVIPSVGYPVSGQTRHVDRNKLLYSNQEQVRYHWQAVITKRLDRTSNTRFKDRNKDPAAGSLSDNNNNNNVASQYKFDDWAYVARGFQEPTKLGGKSLLQRHLETREHMKPTTQRQRIKSRQVYERSVKRVEDLTSYIQFVKDHKEDFQK